jgi:hypothetical protein
MDQKLAGTNRKNQGNFFKKTRNSVLQSATLPSNLMDHEVAETNGKNQGNLLKVEFDELILKE